MYELDNDGYPSEKWIKFIKDFESDTMPIMEFVELLRHNWWSPDWGYRLQRQYRGIRKLHLSTGGWSGNEETINAIISNFWLRNLLGYSQWNIGGHYKFKIPVKSAMQK